MSSDVGRIVSENWIAIECPFCKTVNWVYCGNPHEDTGIDIYSCKCFSCHKFFWLDENARELYRDYNTVDFGGTDLLCVGELDPSEADYEDGKPEPVI